MALWPIPQPLRKPAPEGAWPWLYTAARSHAGTAMAQMHASEFAAPLGRIKFLPSFFEI